VVSGQAAADRRSGLGSLKLAAGERMAIANARLAPYGLAAEQALKAAGLLDLLRPQLVYGENIGQTFSVVATGNARAGLVALSQVMSLPDSARGNWIGVPDDMHEPIRQDAALTVRGRSNEAARAFLDYLKGRGRGTSWRDWDTWRVHNDG
jgi:molybdate transport system substrate-binding protein